MRHRKAFNHLGRKSGHRKAMLANMASSLVLHKKIETTEAKAKALRVYIEPLITKSKEDTTHSRRVVFSYLKQKEAVTELFRVIAPKVADRPGGYTRVLKVGFRQGDGADMAMIELVDFNEEALSATATDKKKSATRRSRSRKKADTTPKVENQPIEENVVVESEEAQEPVQTNAAEEANVPEETNVSEETNSEPTATAETDSAQE